ncbi:MAG TPA: serine/threonine protein kinase, partial [Gemmatimonadaceae bacterium]
MQIAEQLSNSLRDRYRIEREIGSGGMATVYLAHDVRHERFVALKVLNPELGAVLGVERFLAEIRVTAHLQHPNLLPLFDS